MMLLRAQSAVEKKQGYHEIHLEENVNFIFFFVLRCACGVRQAKNKDTERKDREQQLH